MGGSDVMVRGVEVIDAQRTLMAGRCAACGRVRFPPGSMCPDCGGADVRRVALSRTARVFSWTEIHRAGKGWQVPYVVALADFPEGPRVFAQVQAAAARMAVGMAVRVSFGRPPAGLPADAWYFEPALA